MVGVAIRHKASVVRLAGGGAVERVKSHSDGGMRQGGFTLVELVIVVTILAILAAAALPAFQNLQQRARVSACHGALGGVRSGIAIYRANEISLGRSDGVTGTRGYPSLAFVNETGPDTGSQIMSNGDLPKNPFAGLYGISAANEDLAASTGLAPPTTDALTDAGWLYRQVTGQFWANTEVAGENTF